MFSWEGSFIKGSSRFSADYDTVIVPHSCTPQISMLWKLRHFWVHSIHFQRGKPFQRNHRQLLLVDTGSMPSTGHQSTRCVWKSEALDTKASFKQFTFKEVKEDFRDLNTIFNVEQFKVKASMKFTLRISVWSCFKRRKSTCSICCFMRYPPPTATSKKVQKSNLPKNQFQDCSSHLLFRLSKIHLPVAQPVSQRVY